MTECFIWDLFHVLETVTLHSSKSEISHFPFAQRPSKMFLVVDSIEKPASFSSDRTGKQPLQSAFKKQKKQQKKHSRRQRNSQAAANERFPQ